MILTKKALPRRTFLRGAGASIALPLLDAMVPSMTAQAKTPASGVRRLGFVYIPMGSNIALWTPRSESDLSELSPTLSPLEPVKDQVTVLTNLELKNAYPGTHATSNAAFLSAAKAKWTESTDYHLGITVDQVAAKQIGQETQLPSLEMAMDLLKTVGQCDNGFACVYQNNLSWSSPTTPLPAEAHPRLVFERLFGDGGSAAERRAALRRKASLLDFVNEDIARLQGKLGGADRAKVGEYLDTVREVERRIQRAEADTADSRLPDLDRPIGVPVEYADHAKLMFDLQVLALQGDVTRVISFQLAREASNRTYPEAGVPDPHHPTLAPRQQTGKAGQDRQDQPVPRVALRLLSGKAQGDARRGRHAARSFALHVRQRDGQPQRTRPYELADPRRRRGGRQDEGRAAHPLWAGRAPGQSTPDHARQSRRAAGLVPGQSGQDRRIA